MSRKNLHRQVKSLVAAKADELNLVAGVLGITIGGQKTVEVPNRDGYIFVRLRGSQSELIQAYNATVSPIYNLPVLVTREGNHYSVYGRDLEQYSDWGNTPYLPKHGTQHSFAPELGLGGDVTWIYSRQFVPMLAMPSGSAGAGHLIINPYIYRQPSDGSFISIGDEGTQNALLAKPTDGQARLMLLYWDLNLDSSRMITGSLFDASITGTAQIAPYIPAINNSQQIPLAAIRLVSGTAVIGWDNIYDVRQFAVNTPPSFSGGFSVWDEGVPQGTGTIFDFIGAGITATVSGTVAQIVVTATGSGETIWTTGSTGTESIVPVGGSNSDARGDYALAHGYFTLALGTYSHSEGVDSIATGTSSHAEGENTLSFGQNSHSEGKDTQARGFNSHSEGQSTTARGTDAHAEGFGTIALGTDSHSEGQETLSSGTVSHAEGESTKAIGIGSHSEGISTIALGDYSHAEGEENLTSGTASFATGGGNSAIRDYSATIGGRFNRVTGLRSVILGGQGITGSANDTAYMNLANVRTLNSGTAVSNVGINSQGFLVTGSAGGSVSPPITGSVVIQDEGTIKGSALALNFVGGGVEASVSGNVATVFVTGSISAKQILMSGGANGTVGASSIEYLNPVNLGLLASAGRNVTLPIACTLRNLIMGTNSAQPASGSLVVTVLKNNAATALTFTKPAGDGAGQESDLTHSVSFAAGDTCTIELDNNATGASCSIGSCSIEMVFT